MQKKDISIRVGSLIILFLGLFLGVFLFLKKGFFAPQYNTYFIRFSNVSGLNRGSKVTLSGVLIGQVKDIQLLDADNVKVSIEVEKGIKIPRSSAVRLASSLIGIGENGIDIIPPSVIVGYIRAKETLIGQKVSSFTAAFPEMQEMIGEITSTVRTIRQFLTSDETKKGMKYFFKSLDKNISKMGSFMDELHGIAVENRKGVYLALTNLNAAMAHVKDFSQAIARSGYDKKVDHLIENAELSLNRSKVLIEEMRQMIKDPEWRTPFTQSMKNAEKITDSGMNIARDLEGVAKKGDVIADKTIDVLDKVNQLADETSTSIKELKSKWNIFSSPLSSRIKTSGEIGYDLKNKKVKSNINLEVPFMGNDYLVGLSDAFEDNLLNLQMMKKIGDNKRIRYGIYASKPGIGVDFDNNKSGFSLHGDVYGLNRIYCDVKARYRVSKDITTWISLQDLFNQNIPSVGIGILR